MSEAGGEGTEALLRFAAGEAEALLFDRAEVSAGALGAATEGAPWWDGETHGLRLRGRKMAGASLREADLQHANLAGADLSEVQGSGMRLQHAVLEGAVLEEADLIGADLSHADAGEANFSRALLEDAKMHRARLRFANFAEAILDGADLSHADLWGARLTKATAERANLSGARLDESFLSEVDLPSADLEGATLRRANLQQANLRGASLRGTTLDGADLTMADLTRATLPNISLQNCKLQRAKFAGAWLERTRMRADQLGGMVGEEASGDLEGAVDSYTVLEQNFRTLGAGDDTSWAYRRRRRVQKRLHARRAKEFRAKKEYGAALAEALRFVGDELSEFLCDYGESVPRVVRAIACVLVGFAVVYWVTGCLQVREGYAATMGIMPVNYLLFSLNSMTTVVTSEVPLRPANELGMLLSSLQTAFGTTLLGLFGFVLGVRIRG